MPGILLFIALLRKLIRIVIGFIMVVNPLMAADGFVLKNDDLSLSEPHNKACYNTLCIEPGNNKRMPDMFEKPDKILQRERTDPWSTFDHDNAGSSIRLSIGL